MVLVTGVLRGLVGELKGENIEVSETH